MDTIQEQAKEIYQLIIDIVSSGAIRSTELAIRILERLGTKAPNTDVVVSAIESLVAKGEIIELEYVNPDMPYRSKSVYFPRGTHFHSDSMIITKLDPNG